MSEVPKKGSNCRKVSPLKKYDNNSLCIYTGYIFIHFYFIKTRTVRYSR